MLRPPFFLFILLLLFTGCAGNNFDEATIPTDQLAAEMAFKRVADHGGMEAVLEESTTFKDWQFHNGSKSKTSISGRESVRIFHLKDRSGIKYVVKSGSTSASVLDQIDFGYGYASGEILTVKRDLAAGEFEAELKLTSWRERKH